MDSRGPLLVLAVMTGSCHGCHGDHPYVPYAIDSGDGLGASSASAGQPPRPGASASTGATGAPFVAESASAAPPGLARWPVDGVVLNAPSGTTFVSGIARDADGTGAIDGFAIVRGAEPSDPGQVVVYHGRAGEDLAPAAAFAPPAAVVRSASCVPSARLGLLARRSAFAELAVQCPMATNAPDRWVAIVASDPSPTVRLGATVLDPPGAPALTVDADVADRDGDGRPDVALRVTLEGGGAPLEPGPKISATLGWLDRPAGLSRDAAVTEASFSALSASAKIRAARSRDAPMVPNFAAQVRTLWRAVCAEGGHPRLVGVAGTAAVPCGSAKALEEIGLAEVRAYVAQNDPLRATLALDRAERPPAARTPSRATEAQSWVAQLAPVAVARLVRPVAAVPLETPAHELSWGALAFEPSGKLLVRTRAGPVRVDPDTGDEVAAEPQADWRGAVTSPDGSLRWIEAYDPCDGVAVHATFGDHDDLRDVALPIMPPLGDRCAGSRGVPVQALPLGWSAVGLEAIVDGEPVLVSPEAGRASKLASIVEQRGSHGAPISPNGRTLVVPTDSGLLVRTATERAHLLRAPELDGSYQDQRACTVSDDARHVACVRGGKAWVGTWEIP